MCTHDEERLTLEEIEESVEQLASVGLIEDSGERQDGKIVWQISEKGKDPVYRDQALAALCEADEIEEFSD